MGSLFYWVFLVGGGVIALLIIGKWLLFLVGLTFAFLDLEKRAKFRELDRISELSANAPKMASTLKSCWLTSRGIAELNEDSPYNAKASFLEAIQIRPCHIPAYSGLTLVYAQLNRLPEAFATLQRIQEFPNLAFENAISQAAVDYQLNFAAMQVFIKANDFQTALRHAELAQTALRNIPDDDDAIAGPNQRQAWEIEINHVIREIKEACN